MIAEVIVGTWVAVFAYLAGRASTRRFRGRARLGYLADPDERPPAKPSITLLLDTADPSVRCSQCAQHDCHVWHGVDL